MSLRRLPLQMVLGALIAGGVACSAGTDESAGADEAAATTQKVPTATAADFQNADPVCADIITGTHASPISPDALAASEPLLSATGDIPLPSMGPAADGFFWPAKGYIEGGHFSVATARAEQEVDASEIAPASAPGTLRVVEFNVNRGTQLDDLVKILKKQNADVYILIETDLYNLNSSLPSADPSVPAQRVVVGREMARALGGATGYYYVTGAEFYERLTPSGTAKNAVSPLNDITGKGRMGMSGHTIISRYPIVDAARVDLPMYVARGGHDWSTERPGVFSSTFNEVLRSDDLQPQPRCGQRMALAATVQVPSADGGTVPMKFVAIHTENKSNAQIRADQFDYGLYGGASPLLASDHHELAVIAGDLNTLGLGEGGSFRNHLKSVDKLVDTSSAVSPSNEDKTDSFGRIDWMIEQLGSSELPVKSYAVGANEGASDHNPVTIELGSPVAK